jgi:hypothetical protein
MAFTLLAQYKFTSTGAGKKIPLPGDADMVRVLNYTQDATTQATGRGVRFEWRKGMIDDYAIETLKTNNTNALNETIVTSGGFTYVPVAPITEAVVTGGTTITQAAGAACTVTNSYANGDRIRMLGCTGMRQIAGMDFTISSVSGAGFTLLGLDSSGFAAPGTAFTCRRISLLDAVEPRFLFITGISQAASAVVTVSTTHSYTVGDLIHFSIPSSFGMVEMNGLTGRISAIGTYTITVDINSSAFTAFAFPANTLVPTTPLFATLAPAGQRNTYDVAYAPFHSGEFTPYIWLAAGAQSPAGSTSDVIYVDVFKAECGIVTL